MFQHRILALLACAALVTACGTDGGGGTTVTQPTTQTDTVDSGSSSGGEADTGATSDASGAGADTGGNDACDCDAQGAACGFLPGCNKSCGACPVGQSCKSNACSATSNVKLKKFGEWCGPNQDCRPPNRATTDDDNQWQQKLTVYRSCLDDQCEDQSCIGNSCTKSCTVAADAKINHTGDAGDDGIEDPDADSACGDAEDGPYGDKWRCVERVSQQDAANGQTQALCMHGTTFKPCQANSECPTGETCQLTYVYASVESRCRPAKKQKDGKPGAPTGSSCDSDPLSDNGIEMNACAAAFCSGTLGCTDFCKTNDDCNTAAKGACKAGKCGNEKVCKVDSDCSAQECRPRKIYSNLDTKLNMCLPKDCALNSDCPNDFYCIKYWNGVKDPKGEPDPDDKTKVLMPGWQGYCIAKLKDAAQPGEHCDPFNDDDDDKYKKCVHHNQCQNGVCGNLCEDDTMCPKDMKCRSLVYGIDTTEPDDGLDDVFLTFQNCIPLPGAEGECKSSKDCKAGKICRLWEKAVSLPAGATAVDYKYTAAGTCITDDADHAKTGEDCGKDSTTKKICKSGICLGGGSPKWCSELCGKRSDCPALITLGQSQYKMACLAIGWASNSTGDPRDRIMLPICAPYVDADHTMTDCATTKKCPSGSWCRPFSISTGPDKPSSVEYLCMSSANAQTVQGEQPTQPTKKLGEECNREAKYQECTTQMCLPGDKPGKGYCSAACNENTDCGTGMFCDKDNMGFYGTPRKDKANAGVVPICRKKLSCTGCNYDWHCPTGFGCTNLGDAGTLAKQRCAPSCESDKDCAGTDGGAKCVDSVDINGVALKTKVCKPSCS